MFELNLQDNPTDRLRRAVGFGKADEVRLALADGADPNASPMGMPMLMVAVSRDDLPVVNLLIEAGSDINVKNSQGWGPVHEACSNGFVDVLQALLEQEGIRINQVDGRHWTPARATVEAVQGSIRQRLAFELLASQEGFLPDLADDRGVTPLMAAVDRKLPEIVQILLAAGADPTRLDNDNRSAKDRAQGWDEAPQALLDAQAPTHTVEAAQPSQPEEPAVELGVSTIAKRRPR